MQHPIGALASQPVMAVEGDTPALEVLRAMSARRIGRIVVLENDEPVGILTERDMVFTANWVVGQPSLRIREVVCKPVLAAPADLALRDAYRLFRDRDIHHLVVLGKRRELAGLFTRIDLVRALKHRLFTVMTDVAVLMTRRVLRVTPEVTARQVLAMMASHGVSSAVVVEQERPIGVVTEHDAIRLVASGSDLSGLAVGAVMTTPVVTIPASASPAAAVDLMHEHGLRRLVVVDEQGLLAGVLTQTDLSRVLEELDDQLPDRVGHVPADALSSYGPALH
jgi:CBS domain-containing protein